MKEVPLPEPVKVSVGVPVVVNPLLPKRVVIESITDALPVMSIRFHELCGCPLDDHG